VFVIWTAIRIVKEYRAQKHLLRPVLLMVGLVAVQILLGAITVLTQKTIAPTTFHVAVGALILATSLVLTLRTYRTMKVMTVRSNDFSHSYEQDKRLKSLLQTTNSN
jgi:heme A synthase